MLATINGHVVEAALGYFINPIVTVFLGVVVQRERLRPAQWVAVGVSIVAVIVLAIGYGSLPWIALILAFSFGLYGLIKKRVGGQVDAVGGLTLETMWLTPVAIIQLIVVAAMAGLTFGTVSAWHTVLLVGLGVITAIPLLFFAAASRRLPLVYMGFIQYFAPVHPVPRRGGDPARGDAAGALGRLRNRLARAPHPHRGCGGGRSSVADGCGVDVGTEGVPREHSSLGAGVAGSQCDPPSSSAEYTQPRAVNMDYQRRQ